MTIAMKLSLPFLRTVHWRQPAPSRYPDLILRYMVRAYDDPRDDTARTQGLDEVNLYLRSGICKHPGREPTEPKRRAVGLLVQRGHIEHAGYHLTCPTYKPTDAGFAYGREHFAPWHIKALRALGLGSVVRGVMVGLITAVLTAVIATWLGRVWP
jgi:hypothetical protein